MRFDTRHGECPGGQKMIKISKKIEVFRTNLELFKNDSGVMSDDFGVFLQ